MVAPRIIREMCRASKLCGVGPMAAIAGAISEFVGEDLRVNSEEIIVENGGDIYIATNRERRIGIYSGSDKLPPLSIKVKSENTPCGICTSSGKIGHSLSFGKSDSVTIISNSTLIADAAATAIGNILKDSSDIDKALQAVKSINEVLGSLIIIDDKIAAWGDIELA